MSAESRNENVLRRISDKLMEWLDNSHNAVTVLSVSRNWMGTIMDEEYKARALQQFAKRQMDAPEKIDNASLVAGSPMTFYCRYCGQVSDVLPETYTERPTKVCEPCQELVDAGVIE